MSDDYHNGRGPLDTLEDFRKLGEEALDILQLMKNGCRENITNLGKLLSKQQRQIEKMKKMMGGDVRPCARSVAVINALKVSVLGNCYGIPSRNVFEVIPSSEVVIYELEGCPILGYQDRLIPLVHLARYLHPDHDFSSDGHYIVIVKSESLFYGLLVDGVDETEDLVVKKIPGILEGKKYCLGGALTGGGAISLVLDIDELGRKCNIKQHIIAIEKNRGDDTPTKSFLLFDLGQYKNYVVPWDDIFRVESIERKEIEGGSVPYRGERMRLLGMGQALGLGEQGFDGSGPVDVLVVKREREYWGLMVDKMRETGPVSSPVDTGISDREGILGVVLLDDAIASVVNMEFLLGRLKNN